MERSYLSAWFLLHYYNLNHLIRQLAEYVVQSSAFSVERFWLTQPATRTSTQQLDKVL